MFGYDPEVPAGYQDADIEMLEMRDAANEQATECRNGNHNWYTNPQTGYVYCLECPAHAN